MHRLILLSQTWQLASSEPEGAALLDPDNDLYGRYTRQRLMPESIRDAILFVSGDLDESEAGPHPFGGPHLELTQPILCRVSVATSQRLSHAAATTQEPHSGLFEAPTRVPARALRLSSTTPLQALFVMNDPLSNEQAWKFMPGGLPRFGTESGGSAGGRFQT